MAINTNDPSLTEEEKRINNSMFSIPTTFCLIFKRVLAFKLTP